MSDELCECGRAPAGETHDCDAPITFEGEEMMPTEGDT